MTVKHVTVIELKFCSFTCIQIGLQDLNWEQNFPTYQALHSAHKNKEYPPRFILEICGKDAQRSDTVTVSLTNVVQPVSYDINLYMPRESFQRHAYNIKCHGTISACV